MENIGEKSIGINFGVLIILVIVLGGLALLIYFLVYKASINKTLTNPDSEKRVKKMPALSSIAYIVIAIAVLAVIVGVWLDMRAAVEEVSGLYSSLSGQVFQLEANLQEEIDSVADRLQKEKSLFTSVDISYGKPDYKNHSVKLTVNAVPKVGTEDTRVSVQLGDNYTVKLKKVGEGLYSGEAEIDFYKRYGDIALITITENGETRSEELDLSADDVKEKYRSELRYRVYGVDYSYRDGKLNLKVDCDAQLEEDFFEDDSFRLIVKSGGKVILEENILPGDKKSCQAEKNTKVDIYISAVDKCGNTHLCNLYSNFLVDVDEFSTTFYGDELTEQVSDSEGNLIAEYNG